MVIANALFAGRAVFYVGQQFVPLGHSLLVPSVRGIRIPLLSSFFVSLLPLLFSIRMVEATPSVFLCLPAALMKPNAPPFVSYRGFASLVVSRGVKVRMWFVYSCHLIPLKNRTAGRIVRPG